MLQEQDIEEAAVKVLEVADSTKQVRRNHGNCWASLILIPFMICLKIVCVRLVCHLDSLQLVDVFNI